MKRILSEFEFSEEQLNAARNLARECGLCEETARILYGRGLRDKDAVYAFMHPSKAHFISPFAMSGMREAVELITRAREEEWVVVVYGDYDADGVCAATIMRKSLCDFGIEPVVVVPERKNGYGLNAAIIDEIFDEYFPQLFITVDCGISCAEEIEYIKELGAEVIVTDHHELPEVIPECICINPKFKDEYIYDNLCGAGVAFKVGCALNGEAAYKYLDYAAIATVADSVPLTGENRDIVSEGLKLINSNPAKGYSHFLNRQDAVTSQTIAFTVAPKVNAAGRMGDAHAALELFNEDDDNRVFDLSAKLTAYNLERQKHCDELYASAKEMIREHGDFGKIILLANESWNSGFVGIVAARIAEEFSRPAILFVNRDGILKGSARSVENVNVFEALKACSEFVEEFGGHSQAAGVSVREENFAALERALNEYASEHYTEDDFQPTLYINGKLDGEYSARLAKELELLEPYGVGNRRPMFEVDETALETRTVKNAHLAFKSDKIELMYFGGYKYKKLVESNIPKRCIFEYNVSSFRGKEYVKGLVRDIVYIGGFENAAEDIALNAIEALALPLTAGKVTSVSVEETERLMFAGGAGNLFVAWSAETLKKFRNAAKMRVDAFAPSSKSCNAVILLSPSPEADLSGFNRVIYLDNPPACLRLPSLSGRNAELCEGAQPPQYLKNLSCKREEMLAVFAHISSNAYDFEGVTAEEVVRKNAFADKMQTMFALKVFEQLGLISFDGGRLCVNRGVKSKLDNSELYTTVSAVVTE